MELSFAARTAIAARPIRLDVVQDRASWDELIASSTGGNILQSFQWGDFKAEIDWRPVRVAHCRAGRLAAAAQMLLRATPVGRVAYVPRGPILAAGQEEILPDVLAALHKIARDHGAFHLKIEPEWADDLQVARRLRALGFEPARSIQPRSTLVLNLKRDPRELAAALSPRTRYNVGLAARRGVVVGIEHENALPDFYELLRQTSQRHHFPVRPLAYFEKLWAHLAGTGQAHLLVARHDGRPLSAALLLTMGQAVYYMYGGSSDARRSLKPSDLLQWEAIRWARAEGFASYDLWGIPDEVGRLAPHRSDEADGGDLTSRDLWGVYHFKRGFGGRVVRFVGAHDYVYSARRYWLWRVVLPRVRSFRRRVER